MIRKNVIKKKREVLLRKIVSREPENQVEETVKKIDVKAETRKLLKRGKEQGFIAQEDVLSIFPAP